MRVVLDTNVLTSALIAPTGPPATIYSKWTEGAFTLLGCEEQLSELRETLCKRKIAARIRPHRAGRMVNALRSFSNMLESLPSVSRSSDATDNLFLANVRSRQGGFSRHRRQVRLALAEEAREDANRNGTHVR